jgi:hypothetical protein
MHVEGNRDRVLRLLAALLVVVSLILFVVLTQRPVPQIVQVEPTRPRAVAGESGEVGMVYLPTILSDGRGVAAAAYPEPGSAPEPDVSTRSATGPIYWGAYIDPNVPYDMSRLEAFEARLGKGVSIVHWGQPWIYKGKPQRFQTGEFDKVRRHGAIPMVNWNSWDYSLGVNQPDHQLADIIAGTHDAYIRMWAEQAKAWGHPFFLRFNHEMNGWWQFPWSERLNGNKPGEYVVAWRHVHDIFTEVGATNVTWVWAANISSEKTTPLEQVYPGHEYVDWVGMDGYNFGSDRRNIWQTFEQVFAGSPYNTNKNTYEQLKALAPGKPIMIAETASSEDGGPLGRPASKAAWITEALAALPTKFPEIKALVWFNWDENDPQLDWPIDSSEEAVQAFRAGISSSYFAGNDFANLATSPIP